MGMAFLWLSQPQLWGSHPADRALCLSADGDGVWDNMNMALEERTHTTSTRAQGWKAQTGLG